jgi:hypothetical protein
MSASFADSLYQLWVKSDTKYLNTLFLTIRFLPEAFQSADKDDLFSASASLLVLS